MSITNTLADILKAARDESNEKMYQVKDETVRTAYLENLPQTLKDIGFNEEHMDTYGQYNRDFTEGYYQAHAPAMSKFLKEHTELNTTSISSKLPGGFEVGIDFARPTGDKVTKEEWAGSFGMRCSLDANDGLATRLREEIGNLYDEE